MAVYLLDEDLWFPPPSGAEEDGMLAVGGDLSPERLLLAYTNGIFPWYNEDTQIMWWCPKERFVIFPSEIVISKSMKKFMRKTDLVITMNQDFPGVIHNCRKLRENREGTWITDGMEDAYNEMYELGFGVSVEVWKPDTEKGGRTELVGGLYGLAIGRCFFGESMFSKVANASKLALIYLAKCLERMHFEWIDCQFHTDHLESMGGRYISYEEYMEKLTKALQ